MTLSLRQRIFWWSTAGTLVVVVAVFVFADRSFRATIRSSLEQTVEAGARLAAELQRTEVQRGVERAAALAAAPTLRAAVETRDAATIRQNLDRLLEESEMDWLAVADPEGGLLATAGPVEAERIRRAGDLIREARFYDTADLWRSGDALIEVYASGILFGSNLLGVLLSGRRIGPDRMERLQLSSQQRIALLSGGRLVAGGADLSREQRGALVDAWTGTDSALAAAAAEGDGPARAIPREFDLGDARYLGAAITVPGVEGRPAARLVGYQSLEDAMAPARRLRNALVGVAVAGVLLALIFSYFLSRSVTRPLQHLLRETVRLGSGDLEHPVEPERDDEIGRLAEGFDTMRASLLEAREELIRAERLSAVGRAASAVVHDFSQPVNIIQGNVELLEYDWDDPEAREEDLRAIRRQVQRLNSMMQEVLDFARGEDRLERSPGSVKELLEDVARRARRQVGERDVEITVEHGFGGTWSLDFPRTTRVLENLVRNAVAAVGSGGSVRLRSSVEDDVLRLEVEDDGPGIPDSLRDELFEPFVTAGKTKGTGLGLAIARSFTERQDGTIRFATSDEGTTFILEFPSLAEGRA